jgi:hypothetical protein
MSNCHNLKTIILVAMVSICSNNAYAQMWQLGFTKQSPEATAKTLVNNRLFGGGSAKYAIEYGDTIIPLIKSESNNFEKLDNRNSFWIAEVLGSIDTQLARSTLRDLYAEKESMRRLVGAIGLYKLGEQLEPIDDDSFLVTTIRGKRSTRTEGGLGVPGELDSDNKELAIIALGYSKSESVLPTLHEVLTIRPRPYWIHAHACEALARIKSSKSIPVLQDCLQDPQFYALPQAYRAATCLGDKEATHLAIERISKEIEGKNSGFVIDELQLVTGKWWNGRKKEDWQIWWKKNSDKWSIPEKFLADWDKQPKR